MEIDTGIPVFLIEEGQSLRSNPVGYIKSQVVAIGLKLNRSFIFRCGSQGDLELTLSQIVKNTQGQQSVVVHGFAIHAEERKKLKYCLAYCSCRTVNV